MTRYRLFKRETATPPPPPDTLPGLGWVGFASSRLGLSATDAHKRSMALSQVAAMAAQVGGVTADELRSKMMWHSYNPPPATWDAGAEGHIQWAMQNGWGGIIMNQHVGQDNWAAWANGSYDASFRSYLASIVRVRPANVSGGGFRFLVIFDHEPNNNSPTPSQTDAANWAKGTARFMKITKEFADPLIVYSTCMVPNTPITPMSWWNPQPALLALEGGDTTETQKVMDATLAGLDPYPGVNSNGSPQTLASRLTSPMTLMRSWGFTRFGFPEVGFFWGYNGTYPAGTPSAFTQAKRIADELWTWCRANNVEEVAYFDNAPSAAGAISEGLVLDTPQELLVYGRIALGMTPTPIPA